MSRTSLHWPRRTRAVSRRPAPYTRLIPSPSLLNTHYKRCPKAQRLRLRSDQSPSRPMQGRSPDKSRHAPFKGRCQVRAPLIGRNGIAPSGDAQEYGVKLLHWAIAPFSDSPGVHLAGRSEQSDNPRLKTSTPFMDSTVVTIGKFRSTNAGHGSPLPSSLGVVEHFRWTRLPQSEISSRLVHFLSEVWGCRRIDAGVDRPQGRTPHIGTGVADILRKPSGTFHPHPSHRPSNPLLSPSFPTSIGNPSPGAGPLVLRLSKCERGVAHTRLSRLASHPHPPYAVLPSPLPSTNLEACTSALAQALPSVLPSPAPLRALSLPRTPIPVVRVLLWGKGYPLPVGATGGSPSPLRHVKSPVIPIGVVQSKQLRVQSTFNQCSIKIPTLQLNRNRIHHCPTPNCC